MSRKHRMKYVDRVAAEKRQAETGEGYAKALRVVRAERVAREEAESAVGA